MDHSEILIQLTEFKFEMQNQLGFLPTKHNWLPYAVSNHVKGTFGEFRINVAKLKDKLKFTPDFSNTST